MKLNRRGFMKALAALGLTGLPEAPAEEAVERVGEAIEMPSPGGLGEFDDVALFVDGDFTEMPQWSRLLPKRKRPFVHVKRNIVPESVRPLGSELFVDVGYGIRTRVFSGFTEWLRDGILSDRSYFLQAMMHDLWDDDKVLALARRDIAANEWDTPLSLVMWFVDAELMGDYMACGDVVWLGPSQTSMSIGPIHGSADLDADAVAKLLRDAVVRELHGA